MLKALFRGLVLLLAASRLASAQPSPTASAPPGKLTVAVGSTTASSSQEVEIPVTLAAAKNLGALELVLTYDPAVLEAKSADRGALLSSNSLVEYFVNPNGRLAVTLVSQDGVTGDGAVVAAHFLVKGQAGQKSALGLENVRAWEGKTRLDFLVSTTAGEFTVGGGWPWWWVAVVVGAVLLLLLLLKFARRTRAPTPPALPTPAAAARKEPPPLKPRCPKCGQPIDRGSAFCNHCGQKLTA